MHEISKTQAAILSRLLQLWLNTEHIPDEECAASKEFYRLNRPAQSPTVLIKMFNSTIIVINVKLRTLKNSHPFCL